MSTGLKDQFERHVANQWLCFEARQNRSISFELLSRLLAEHCRQNKFHFIVDAYHY